MAGSVDRKALLVEAGLALASELSLPLVLQQIVELAARLTDARYGALAVLGRDGRRISEFVTTGLTEEERRAIGAYPAGRGVLGALIEDARPLRLARVSDDPRSVGFPPHHPPMTTFLGAPLQARGRVFGNLYLAEKRGGQEFTQEDEDDLLVLAAQAGVAVANATTYSEARHREQWLNALWRTTGAILGDAPVDSVLQLICRHAREMAEADLATVVTPASKPGRLVVRTADGPEAATVLELDVPVRGSISGDVMRTGRPLVLEDASHDARAFSPMVMAGQMGPSIFVPLVVRGRSFGTLAVSSRVGAPAFPESAVQLVETFANQASVALEYAQARRNAERLAIMDDRERIAKDLHDGIIQSLFAVGIGLQGTAAIVGDSEAAPRIESAVDEIDRVIRDLRNYIFGLRPGILADRQLEQALHALAEEMEELSGIQVALELDRDVAAELSGRASELVQLTRESLSNVRRHAAARHCQITLRRSPKGAVLSIVDDGRGFDPKSVTLGQGLANIRGRLRKMNGSMRLDTTPGRGTRLRLTIPL